MSRMSKLLLGIVVAIFVVFFAISGKYLDWLWFKTLGTTSVFWVSLLTGPLAKLVAGLVIFIFFLVNFFIAVRAFDRIQQVDSFWSNVSKKTIVLAGLAASAILAFLIATGLGMDWTVIQQFLNQVKTGVTDPFFKQDIGYYLFSFPFYQQLNTLLVIVTFLGLAGTGVVYFLAKAYWKHGRSWELWQPAKVHLIFLTILFLVVKIWGYMLGKYGLLFQETSRITGINYTAEHARLFGLNALIWILVAIIAILLVNIFTKGSKLFVGSLIVWLICSFALVTLYPSAIQAFVVTPNEYEMEKPYLEKHIDFTRKAYDLDKIKTNPYLPHDTGKNNLLDAGNSSLADLRLWDYKPLRPSYNQLQSIRPYYEFTDIDIDRYPAKNGQRQVMLAARELNTDKLSDARTWINFHLNYTHGYGIAANQVNEFSSQGQPIFIARDLPPKADPNFPSLAVNNPGIYFGEMTNHYVIVNTGTKEFDFPQGEENIYNTYQGPKGISLASTLTRFVMSLRFQEANFMLSSQLTAESSVLMYRNINERVRMLAPFLIFDSDPYLVVSGGKLYWIIDAYTASAYYPYAKLHTGAGLDYIRNSVKTVVDAYTGEVNFYITDQTDPIINVWQKVFPSLFKKAADLSPDLARHFRYPEFLLTIQRDMLLQYHMTDPQTFYAKEDSWEVPTHNQNELFEPYYVTLQMPGEKKPEFVMMQPFSPRGKQNLIGWLIARCDQPNYGQLVLYRLPKDQNIYGPNQIDSRINQDQTISQLVTLWNQQQSRIIWGNLLIIPIEDTILYVKPMFMESETGQQAELKKIVMVYQNQVLIGNSIAEALNKVSLNPVASTTQTTENTAQKTTRRKAEILQRLQQLIAEQQKLVDELNGL